MAIVLGSYNLLQQIPSEDSFYSHYRAIQQPLGRTVDIAIYHLEDPHLMESAYNWAIEFGKISHPNLETILDVGIEENKLILVREAWEGEPFSQWFGHSFPLKNWQVEQLFYQIAQGACKLGEKKVLFDKLGFEHLFMATTSDGNQLIKVIAPHGSMKIIDAPGLAAQLANIGFTLLRGNDAGPLPDVTSLDQKYPGANHGWIRLLWNWAHGQQLPKDFGELLGQITVNSLSLSNRRDTWTLGNNVVHIEPPSRRTWPMVIGAVLGLLFFSCGAWFFMHHDEPQVYDGPVTPVKVAMTGAFSGPNKELGLSMRHGLELAFKEFNAVRSPHSIVFSSLDDGYESKKAKENAQQILNDKSVAALIGTIGTAASAEIRPLATGEGRLFLGAFSGADFLQREGAEDLVYNYRPRYSKEINTLLTYQIKKRGINPEKIAFFYQNGPYGLNVLDGAYKTLKNFGVKNPREQLLHTSYRINSLDIGTAAASILEKRDSIELLVLISTYDASGALIKDLAENGFYPPMVAMSSVGANVLAEFIKELRVEKIDLQVGQVVPDVHGNGVMAQAYRSAEEQFGEGQDLDSVAFEGYINGRILVEAVKKSPSGQLSGTDLDTLLESGVNLDLEGAGCSFSNKRHFCLEDIWLATIDNHGQLTWGERQKL